MIETSLQEELYEIVDYDTASPQVKKIYDETKTHLGLPFVLNWFKCQGNNPTLLKGNWEKLRTTLLAGEVPLLLKQLIIYNVSAKRGCSYCRRAHAIFANIMGKSLSDDPGFRITDDLEKLPTSHLYSTAIRVVTKAALHPASIDADDFEALADEGFSISEIRELMAQADLVNMLNTIADISHIKIDNELLEIEG